MKHKNSYIYFKKLNNNGGKKYMKNLLEVFKNEEVSLNDFLKASKTIVFKLLIFIAASLDRKSVV